jgi:hypothetical protein
MSSLAHYSACAPAYSAARSMWSITVNSIVYLVGLIVIVLAILSFVGVR